ncbi:MAG: hypothetical protein KKG59_07115 [Nanoarchaeota archaeon]|nr:hypothetical protein [Nanoarchaeota archaeon]
MLWLKTPEKDIRIEKRFQMNIYIADSGKDFLEKHNIKHTEVKKQNYLRKTKTVFQIPIYNLSNYVKFIRFIEKKTRYRIPLYNADIKPEQFYLYKHNLKPFCAVHIEDSKSQYNKTITPLQEDAQVHLKKMEITVIPESDIRANKDTQVKAIIINNMRYQGDENTLLKKFAKEFIQNDPDVIVMSYAFSMLPFLQKRMQLHSIGCPFHRWDSQPINYKGGKSFFTYGVVRYQDFAIRLHGRLLVDTSTSVGSLCDTEAIMELCQISGTCFQQLASKSFGAVFQSSLVRQMVQLDLLVHYKTKPIDKPFSMYHLLKADRGGHVFDPIVGFHKNVAEIDFCSMYPWLIYNYNIGSDCIQSDEPPFQKVPGVPIKVSLARKSLVPLAVKPLLDKRMEYKKNPTTINKQRAVGLKWVLVSSYGYLRYREFKLGIPSSHMAICSYAREIIIMSARLAEERGFEVVHGIIDSLYIKPAKGKSMSEKKVKDFCRELQELTGIPISFDGLFRWICFLPSIVDQDRPVPTKYFGAFKSGGLKTRGIEVRQRTPPLVVKYFQQKVLEEMGTCKTKKDIREKIPKFCRLLYTVINGLPKLGANWLSCLMRVSKTDYKHNIPQKKAVDSLKKKGIIVLPGQNIKFVYQRGNVVLPEEYSGKPDIQQYKKLLVKALWGVLQPFGITKQDIIDYAERERQSRLKEYLLPPVMHIFVPMKRADEEKNRAGLSEKRLRQRLEKQGWTVWLGSSIGVTRKDEVYPNVRKKYELLNRLIEKYFPGKLEELQYLCHAHHGIPDFLCYRHGVFKFVECKLGHEQLSSRQRVCIARLQEMGFAVEVHKLVDDCTKARITEVNIVNGKKVLLEVQRRL